MECFLHVRLRLLSAPSFNQRDSIVKSRFLSGCYAVLLAATLPALPAAAQEVMEAFLLERIQSGAALPGTYPPNAATRAAFEVWRRERGK